MTGQIPVLTPAQISFLSAKVPGFSIDGWIIEFAGQAGSDRRFVRAQKKGAPDDSYVLVIWNSGDNDWKRFIDIQNDLMRIVTVLPVIYAFDNTHGLILEEDLGRVTLNSFCKSFGEWNHEVARLYRMTIDALALWQRINPSACATIAGRAMDEEMFLWETSYFALHCVTEFFGCDFLLDAAWEEERRRLAVAASSLPHVCIHRDFQSENIMARDGRIRFVDYQGARLGPAGYDLASLLCDPYVKYLGAQHVEYLLGYYRSQVGTGLSDRDFGICAAQRLMQALGAYGNLSIHKDKERYREFVAPALQRLDLVMRNMDEYPAIRRVVGCCLEKTRG
jgi:hypothetical protein